MPLSQIRIVLVEPAGPLNVGSVARVMKNFGLSQLVLVNPQCDPQGPEARQMAVHAIDLLTQAQQVPNLAAALQGCHRAVATTGRDRDLPLPTAPPPIVLPWLLQSPGGAGRTPPKVDSVDSGPQPMVLQSALIFGREDRGLTNPELLHAQRCLHIPSHPQYPSLNLAQAVAICCYELANLEVANLEMANLEVANLEVANLEVANLEVANLGDRSSLPPLELSHCKEQASPSVHNSPGTISRADFSPPAPLEALEAYYQHLETVLLRIGYLYPHTAQSRMAKFRCLYYRAEPSAQEVALLRGILRQVEWALDAGESQNDPRL